MNKCTNFMLVYIATRHCSSSGRLLDLATGSGIGMGFGMKPDPHSLGTSFVQSLMVCYLRHSPATCLDAGKYVSHDTWEVSICTT